MWIETVVIISIHISTYSVRALPKRNPDQFFFVSLIILKILPPCVLISNALTYICRSFGYGEVGAHTPGSSMVVLLATAAVWPCGVVLALAAQLPLVEHAAVGVQVALAPETEKTDDGDMNRHHSVSAESIPSGVNSQFFFHPHCVYLRFWIFFKILLFFLHCLIEIQAGYLTGSRASTKIHYARL